MKIRDSGMPGELPWNTFFEPENILSKLAFSGHGGDTVEFGCGYGTFTIPAARMASGIIYALDIEQEMIEETKRKCERFALKNIRLVQRDFILHGSGFDSDTIEYAMLFNILHLEAPVSLLREAYRILIPGGKVSIIHWNYDASIPRGPDMRIRPKPDQCLEWMISAGFEAVIPFIDLPPYHYGLVGRK